MKPELAKLHHERSQKDFPHLKLEPDEYVELAITRAKIGLAVIWGAIALGYIVLSLSLLFLVSDTNGLLQLLDPTARSFLNLIVIILYGVMLLVGLVSTNVYLGNKLYVTNKRLIHQQAISLFARSTNIIDLASIEDVSLQKTSFFEYLLRLGTLRMSTVGDETTYTFKYVSTPQDELETIMHLVHTEKSKKNN